MSSTTVKPEVQVRQEAGFKYLFVSVRAQIDKVGEALGGQWERLYRQAAEQGLTPAGPCFAAYPEDNFNPQDFELWAAVPVTGEPHPAGEIRAAEVQPGRVAVMTVKGGYENLPAAYEAMGAWMRESGHQVRDAWREVYLVSWDRAQPQDFVTEIVAPIQG
ncbi:MAG TPA: GyrI-like domain-containing protein [Deinococcales bacterium]|nr:GyrI-like domain-containing protein [Deinococcales bacterium]